MDKRNWFKNNDRRSLPILSFCWEWNTLKPLHFRPTFPFNSEIGKKKKRKKNTQFISCDLEIITSAKDVFFQMFLYHVVFERSKTWIQVIKSVRFCCVVLCIVFTAWWRCWSMGLKHIIAIKVQLKWSLKTLVITSEMTYASLLLYWKDKSLQPASFLL